MKQLIENMIFDYLEESYTDDLVESIFEEVSEETWDAIEEAILNELSPALLKRYSQKATADASAKHRAVSNNDSEVGRISYDTRMKYEPGSDEYKSGAKKVSDLRKSSGKLLKKAGQRRMGAGKADLKTLDANEFERKYHMTKAEWERRNK